MSASDLVMAMTGASGAPYGIRLLEVLLQAGRTVHLTVSPSGAEVIAQELERTVNLSRFRLAEEMRNALTAVLETFPADPAPATVVPPAPASGPAGATVIDGSRALTSRSAAAPGSRG